MQPLLTFGKVYSLQRKLNSATYLLPQHRQMVENQPITIRKISGNSAVEKGVKKISTGINSAP